MAIDYGHHKCADHKQEHEIAESVKTILEAIMKDHRLAGTVNLLLGWQNNENDW
jgi:hypothetical protein